MGVRHSRRPAPIAVLMGAGLGLLAVAVLAALLFALKLGGARSLDDARATERARTVPRAQQATPSPAGGRVESRTLQSRTLGRSLPYLVFLPPGYDAEPERRYPVLYMLHGLGGDYREWTEYRIFEEAERLIEAGEMPPLLIVLPEGNGSYWTDHANNGPRWGTYVVRDVVGEVDGRYRTLADRAHRAVGGNSMGAHGALQLAMNFPEVFGVAGAHSPTLRGRDTLPPYFGDRAFFEAHDPATLIERRPEVARTLKLWIDVGDGDFWTGPVTAFHERLLALGIPHEFRIFPGPHEDEYWTGNAAAYLTFYGEAMK